MRDTEAPLIRPWLGALLVALAMCSGYPFMYGLRRTWQSHYPALAAQWPNNGRFTVLGWFGTEVGPDELANAANVKNASQHLLAYDPYIREHRTAQQFVIDRVSYSTMGLLARLVGDISWTWILTRFLCCLAWFLLLYHWLAGAGESPGPAVFCAAFVTCFSYVLTFQFLAVSSWSGPLWRGLAHNAWGLLAYGRTEGVIRLPRPGLTYAFLFLAVACLRRTASAKTWLWPALSGVLGGALAYVHLDGWSLYLAAAGLFAPLESLRQRRWVWGLWASVALSALLSLPYLYCLYPPNREFLVLAGAVFGRHFDWPSLAYLAMAALGWRLRKDPSGLLTACLVAATFVMVNINLVTGYALQPDHWRNIGNIYAFILVLLLLPKALKARPGPWLALSGVLAGAALLQGLSYAAIHYPLQGLPRDYEQALAWLDRRAPKDLEVLALDPEVNMLIPAFTRHKVDLSYGGSSSNSTYPLARGCERLLGILRFFDVDQKAFFAGYKSSYDNPRESHMGLRRTEAVGFRVMTSLFSHAVLRDSVVNEALERAAAHPAELQPDYVWFGPVERKYARKRFAAGTWPEVYRNATVTIYAPSGAL